jgi:hypothetical protein
MSILIIHLTIKNAFDGYNSAVGRATMHREESSRIRIDGGRSVVAR